MTLEGRPRAVVVGGIASPSPATRAIPLPKMCCAIVGGRFGPVRRSRWGLTRGGGVRERRVRAGSPPGFCDQGVAEGQGRRSPRWWPSLPSDRRRIVADITRLLRRRRSNVLLLPPQGRNSKKKRK